MAASAPPAIEAGANQKSPSEFLKMVLGRPVVVKLNSGVEYEFLSFSACYKRSELLLVIVEFWRALMAS